jgi:hypothetical protein
MHSRKFYRTTFIYEVLSEDEPVDNCLDLGTLREVTPTVIASGASAKRGLMS